jgi:hypothetical protein
LRLEKSEVGVVEAEADHGLIVKAECVTAASCTHDPVDEAHIADPHASVLLATRDLTFVRASGRSVEIVLCRCHDQKCDDRRTLADGHEDREVGMDLPSRSAPELVHGLNIRSVSEGWSKIGSSYETANAHSVQMSLSAGQCG